MAVLTRVSAPLVVLGRLVTCGTEQPPCSPTGTATGRYVPDGGTVEVRDDDRCAPGTVGGREFVLTRHPWALSDDDG